MDCRHRPLMGVVSLLLFLLPWGGAQLQAQQPTAQDRAIDVFRGDPGVPSAANQNRIAEWIETKIDELVSAASTDGPGAFRAFRDAMAAQRDNGQNSPGFRTALAEQLGDVAAKRFSSGVTDHWVARAMAQSMVDFNRMETVDGLVAGLRSSVSAARFLCARGLTLQQSNIGADAARQKTVVAALQTAGLAETDSVALNHIYLALANASQVASSAGALLAILTKRSTDPAALRDTDRAEVDAFEFLRNSNVVGALNNDQKKSLVNAVAAFLRRDAMRYADDSLTPEQIIVIEQRLVAAEEVLLALQISGGGNIQGSLENGGHATNRAAVIAEIKKWIGDSKSNAAGALNQQPWNVAMGAP